MVFYGEKLIICKTKYPPVTAALASISSNSRQDKIDFTKKGKSASPSGNYQSDSHPF